MIKKKQALDPELVQCRLDSCSVWILDY